ncbi:MAG TPA: type VI secretion IcmF C-terminal domain-containing protein, partial [Burkholderiaceae bacterium]
PAGGKGVLGEWFKERIPWLRDAAQTAAVVEAARAQGAQSETGGGRVASEFAAIARLVDANGSDAGLLHQYLAQLSRLRTRLNQIKMQGDPGPAARQLMQQTLDASGSELADALRFVDEQMLVGMQDAQKQALRPVLVRPLMQTYAVILQPVESELNKTWQAQVLAPFQANLAAKAPFTAGAAQAQPEEIAQVFGPAGAIAKFAGDALGQLVVRRGDALTARTWAGMGVVLNPQVTQQFAAWVAPAGGAAQAETDGRKQFQLRALAPRGALEYTVEIDGQSLRSRDTAGWVTMVYPGGSGAGLAAVTAVTSGGQTVDLFRAADGDGLKRLIEAAARKRRDDGSFELTWSQGAVAVPVELRLLTPAPGGARSLAGIQLPARVAGAAP